MSGVTARLLPETWTGFISSDASATDEVFFIIHRVKIHTPYIAYRIRQGEYSESYTRDISHRTQTWLGRYRGHRPQQGDRQAGSWQGGEGWLRCGRRLSLLLCENCCSVRTTSSILTPAKDVWITTWRQTSRNIVLPLECHNSLPVLGQSLNIGTDLSQLLPKEAASIARL